MAANIDISTGRYASVYVGKAPWHPFYEKENLLPEGTILTPQQLLVRSGTNWEIERTPLTFNTTKLVRDEDGNVVLTEALDEDGFVLNDDGTVKMVPKTESVTGTLTDHFLLSRNDTGAPLHVCSDSYEVHQHLEVWDIALKALEIAAEYGVDVWPVAGFGLNGGTRITYCLQFRQGLEIGGAGQPFVPYLMLTTSHDESWKTTYKYVFFRPECENMTRAALRGEGKQFTMKHSAPLKGKIAQIREVMEFYPKVVDSFTAQVQAMLGWKITEDEFSDLRDKTFEIEEKEDRTKAHPSVRRRAEVTSMYHNDKRVGHTGTAYGFYQAVNTWELHVRGDDKKQVRQEKNINKFLSDDLTFTNRALALLSDGIPVAV